MIKELPNLLLTLLIGLLSGQLFKWMGAPGPYLIGSLCGVWVTGRALAGLRDRRNGELRHGLLAAIQPGVSRGFLKTVLAAMSALIGGAFDPSIGQQLAEWSVTVVAMLVTTFAATAVGVFYLHRLRGYPVTLSVLCSIPGGQAEIVSLSRDLVERDHVVIFCHLIRVTAVFILTPLLIGAVEGEAGIQSSYAELDALPGLAQVSPVTLLQLVAIAAGGYFGARLIRLPTPHLMGPMLLSAVLHFNGWVQVPRINELVLLAQLTIAGMMGARLAGVKVAEFGGYLGDAIVNAILLISTFCLAALVISNVGPVGFLQALLAFIPGGLHEVTLLALIFGFDMAFVAFHHTARFLIIFMTLPFVVRLIR